MKLVWLGRQENSATVHVLATVLMERALKTMRFVLTVLLVSLVIPVTRPVASVIQPHVSGLVACVTLGVTRGGMVLNVMWHAAAPALMDCAIRRMVPVWLAKRDTLETPASEVRTQ